MEELNKNLELVVYNIKTIMVTLMIIINIIIFQSVMGSTNSYYSFNIKIMKVILIKRNDEYVDILFHVMNDSIQHRLDTLNTLDFGHALWSFEERETIHTIENIVDLIL